MLAAPSRALAQAPHPAGDATLVDLSGPWRYHTGDDLRWADPRVDDSRWPTLEIPEEPGFHPSHPLGEWLWLRRTVASPAALSANDLAVVLPPVQQACEVFADGRRVGVIGDLARARMGARLPLAFEIPRRESSVAGGPLVLALRVRVERALSAPPGGMWNRVQPGPFLLTSRSAAHRIADASTRATRLQAVLNLVVPSFAMLFIGLFFAYLWLRRRDRRTYLSLATFLFAEGVDLLLDYAAYTDVTSLVQNSLLARVLLVLRFWVVAALVTLFVRMVEDRPLGRFGRAYLALNAALSVATLASVDVVLFVFAHSLTIALWGIPLVVCIVLAVRGSWRGTHAARYLLGGVFTAAALIVFNNWLVRVHPTLAENLPVQPGNLGMLALVGSMVLALLDEFVRSLATAEAGERDIRRLNADLQTRMAQLEEQKIAVDGLNADLRRQIGLRSRQLADALATVGDVPDSTVSLAPGMRIDGRYEVVKVLGQGGMGEVYEVERTRDRARFALKMLRGAKTGEHLARFAREAQIAAQIDHPNVVAVRDFDVTPGGAMYVVMDLVRGGSLEAHRERFGDAPWARAVLRQVLEGLAALHDAGVIHRDMKPGNVMLDEAGVAKITDFGIAMTGATDTTGAGPASDDATARAPESARDRLATAPTLEGSSAARAAADPLAPTAMPDTLSVTRAAPPAGARGAHADEGRGTSGTRASRLTRAGVWMGTPVYMAPELLEGATRASAGSDMWAFGALACEVLTGQLPFETPPFLSALAGLEPESPRVPLPDGALRDTLVRCFDPDPARRPGPRDVMRTLSIG